MKKIITIALLTLSLCSYSQPGNLDEDNESNFKKDKDKDVPIDKGIVILAAVGLVYGLYKHKKFS